MIKEDVYKDKTDEELVMLYKRGEDDAADFLVYRHKNFVRIHARPYYLVGADSDDVIQEGMIGLYKAIRNYNVEKGVNFLPFAALCIDRQIITTINAYNCKKNSPLNECVSLDATNMDESGEEKILSNIITSDRILNPEEIVIAREQKKQFLHNLSTNLSKLESQIFKLYIEGYSYAEISEEIGKNTKVVDNAIQRIRNKINLIRK